MTTERTDCKLHEQLLLSRRVEGDRLILADAVIEAAIDGSRALTEAECAALQASPLTLRRFRALAQQRRGERRNDWRASAGMLRAASDGALESLTTDDGYWTLHFLEQGGTWRVILAVDAGAPFAARLLRDKTLLHVLDGTRSVILQGSLDSDGECEGVWPFARPPGPHFQHAGAAFSVAAAG